MLRSGCNIIQRTDKNSCQASYQMAPYLTTYNEIDKTWSGPKQSSIYNYDISVGRVIFTEMKNWPNNVCQVSANSKY